jgi:hypothetical protein
MTLLAKCINKLDFFFLLKTVITLAPVDWFSDIHVSRFRKHY